MTKIKENAIRPEEIFREFLNLCAQDAENFFDAADFEKAKCPGCLSDTTLSEFEKHSFRYVECGNCHSLYVSPRPKPDALAQYYMQSNSATFWAEEVIRKTQSERRAAIVAPNLSRISSIVGDKALKPHKIIDVGAGSGAFLEEWKKTKPSAELHAIEPGPTGAEACRNLGATVFQGTVEDSHQEIGQVGDVVTCFEVIEHVQDPNSFAEAIFNLVNENGTAIVTGLGVDGFDIQLLWEKSRSVMPPHHLNFLSARGMQELFKRAGFSKVDVISPGRLDVEIVQGAIERNEYTPSNRLERLLFSKSEETLKAFQEFLAQNQMSSHVWIVCSR